MRSLSRRRDYDEDGVTIVIMAASLTVLLAVAALVIDIGALLNERRQLQNGADAAALAVAKSCGAGSCDPTLAESLADANAEDRAARVDSVSYPAPGQVKVVLITEASDGGRILPFNFAQAVTGHDGATVHASATAAWGGVGRASVIPLVISICEFNAATSGGTVFNTTFTGPVRVVYFHADSSAAGCDLGPSGSDIPGGFGWVDSTGCRATISVDTTVSEKPGNSAPCDISALVGTTVLVPIYTSVNGLGGSNGTYGVYAFAEFRLVGYRFPSMTAGTPVPCKQPNSCVAGYFTRLVNVGEVGGGPDLGATTVSLVN